MKIQRLNHGLTLDQLAEACKRRGVNADGSMLSRIERGLRSPRPPLRVALIKILDLEVTDLPMEERSAS